MIQLYLEGLISDQQIVITPKRLFNEVKQLIDLDYDKFVLALTYLFKTERIPGYTFVRDGSICHKDNIPDKPKIEEPLLKPKAKIESVNINGINYIALSTKDTLIKILRDIFHAREGLDGKVTIGGSHFDCDTEILYRFLKTFYGLKEKENTDENSCAVN